MDFIMFNTVDQKGDENETTDKSAFVAGLVCDTHPWVGISLLLHF